MNHLPVGIREAEVASLEAVGQPRVIEAQQVEVVDVDWVAEQKSLETETSLVFCQVGRPLDGDSTIFASDRSRPVNTAHRGTGGDTI